MVSWVAEHQFKAEKVEEKVQEKKNQKKKYKCNNFVNISYVVYYSENNNLLQSFNAYNQTH